MESQWNEYSIVIEGIHNQTKQLLAIMIVDWVLQQFRAHEPMWYLPTFDFHIFNNITIASTIYT